MRWWGVTTVTPMKRGLKGLNDGFGKLSVTTVTPMKRGLKVPPRLVGDGSLQPLPR